MIKRHTYWMLAVICCLSTLFATTANAELVQNYDFSGATESPWSHSGYAPWGGSWVDLGGDYFRGAGWGDGISWSNNAVWQDTGATFAADTVYVMTVEWRDPVGTGGADFKMQLALSETTGGTDVATSLAGPVAAGNTWETAILVFDTASDPSVVGKGIGVGARNMDIVGGAWLDVNYISLVIGSAAYGPVPGDGESVDSVLTEQLSWSNPPEPVGTFTSQVYLGTPDIGSAALVPDVDNTDNVASVTLLPGQNYQWRVDVTDSGTGGTITGDVWSFQTTSGPANNDVAINPDVTYQTFEGFGVGTMDQFIPYWYTVWSPTKLGEYLDKMYTLDNDGLGLEITRVPMPVGDDPSHAHMWAYNNPGQGQRSPDAFEPSDGVFDWTGHEDILWHIQGAAARGVKMWAFWHGVPHWMSVSGCSAGHTDGAQNNLQAGKEARFAEHMCDVIEHFRDYWSVDFDYIGAINEPDENWWVSGGNQPGCHVSSSQAVTIYQELKNEMTTRGLTQKLVAPDSFSSANDHNLSYLDTMLNSSVGPDLAALACHQYYVTADGMAQWYWRSVNYNRGLWMSEWGDWTNDGYPDNNPLLQAKNYANKIQQGLKDLHTTAYVFWESDFFLNTTTSSFTLRKSYWVAAQFTRFIRSGMQLLYSSDGNSNCKTTVWIDPIDDPAGQKLVLVTVNDGAVPVTANYDLSPFRGVKINEVRRTSPTEDYTNVSFTQSSLFDFSVYAPSDSVVTVSARVQRCEDMAGEMTGDCIVGIDDLRIVAFNWMDSVSHPCLDMPGNTNDDCEVGLQDLSTVLSYWKTIQAFTPAPADAQSDVNPNGRLSWGDNYYAVSYDIYIGSDQNDVRNATSLSAEYKGNQTDAVYPISLNPSQQYFWRIDVEDALGGRQTGDVWSFTTGVATVDPDLVGWWKLDETFGSAQDSSASNNNGTLYGNAVWAWTQGEIAGAIDLDGNGDYVFVPGFDLTSNNVTFTAWINGWKAADWAGIVYSRSAQACGMHFGGGNTLHYTWNYDDPLTWNWGGGPVIPQNQWALVALVIEPNKATLYVYSDATGLQSSVNNIAHVPQTIDDLKFGTDDIGGSRYFNGLVDDVRIYNRALTEQEILNLIP